MRLFAQKKRQPPEQTPEERRLALRRNELSGRILRELCEVRPAQFDFYRKELPVAQTHDRREICLN